MPYPNDDQEQVQLDHMGENEGDKARVYQIYIKSHCEAPDFEDFTLATSKDEAMENFKQKHLLLNHFDDSDLLKNIDLYDEKSI